MEEEPEKETGSWEGVLPLAVTLDDVLDGPLIVVTSVIILVFSFDDFPPPPDCGVDVFLKASLMPCHFPLPASRKIAAIWQGKWRRELQRACTCSCKQLMQLLQEGCAHVANSDCEVLCNVLQTLLEEKNCFHSSSVDHLLAATVKVASG